MAGGTGLILLALALAAAPLDGEWRRCADSDPDTAIAGCSAVIKSGEETVARVAAAHYNRGIAYRSKSQYERAHRVPARADRLDLAIADYSRAIALKPDYAEALVNRAIAWFDKGRFDRVIADCDRAIQLQPNLAEAYNNRALAYFRQGRFDRAQPDFDRTIVLQKNYGNALIIRGLPPYSPRPADTMR